MLGDEMLALIRLNARFETYACWMNIELKLDEKDCFHKYEKILITVLNGCGQESSCCCCS